MESWLQVVPGDVRVHLLAFLANTPADALMLRDLGYVTNDDMLLCVQSTHTRAHFNRTAPLCTLAGLANEWVDCVMRIGGTDSPDYLRVRAALDAKANYVRMAFPPFQPMDYVACAYLIRLTMAAVCTGFDVCSRLMDVMITRRLSVEFRFGVEVWRPSEQYLWNLIFGRIASISAEFRREIMHIPRILQLYYDAWIHVATHPGIRGCDEIRQSAFIFARRDAPNVLVLAINNMNYHGLGWCSARPEILENNIIEAMLAAGRLANDVDPKRAEYGKWAVDMLHTRLVHSETHSAVDAPAPPVQPSSCLCLIC